MDGGRIKFVIRVLDLASMQSDNYVDSVQRRLETNKYGNNAFLDKYDRI